MTQPISNRWTLSARSLDRIGEHYGRQVAGWFRTYRWELLFVAVLTGIAAFLRVYRITDLPPGLHGDEALTGLDALRILDEGWIGPYIESAIGQPTGPLYFTAFIFKLSHASLFTVRLSMAILGIATVPAAYMLVRYSFGRQVAVFAVIALVFSFWHLHFSRTAFMLISMPLIGLLAVLAVLWAIRSTHLLPWLVAGLLTGAGVYTYNGYPLFLAGLAAALAVVFALRWRQWRSLLLRYGLLAAGFVILAFPFIQFVVQENDVYLSHSRQVRITENPEFAGPDKDFGDKFGFVFERTRLAAGLLIRHSQTDYVDATGTRGALDPVLAVLAYAGLGIALYRWRNPPYLLAALMVLAGLSAVVLTTEFGGDMRRSIVALPFVYVLAGVSVKEGVAATRRHFGHAGLLAGVVAVGAILAFVVSWNTWYYFGDLSRRTDTNWVFAGDLVDSLDAAHSFGDPGTIYFYSARWSYNYETRQFLYPDTPGIDRSDEFGTFTLERSPGDAGPVTYVFLPPYTADLGRVRLVFPGGQEVRSLDDAGNMRFGVYRLE